MIDCPADIWLPSKPAVIRPAEHSLFKVGAFLPVTRAERRAIVSDLVRTRRLTWREAEQALLFVPVVGWSVEEPYVANAVDFDGSLRLERGANLTGAANSDKFTMSVWLNPDTISGHRGIMGGRISSPLATRFSVLEDGRFEFSGVGTGNPQFLGTTASITAGSGWVHVVISVDTNSTSTRHVYRNGIDDDAAGGSWTTWVTNAVLDWTWDNWYIGDSSQFSNNWDGQIAELMLWIGAGSYLDLSLTSNLRMFIDAGGKPVDPNKNGGAIDTLGTPIILLTNPYTSWEQNNGSGGDFSEVGSTLGAAPSSPSD